MTSFTLPLLLAFFTSFALVYLIGREGSLFQIMDLPNERSLHQIPTPRTGGLGIWAGGLAGLGTLILLLGIRSELAWIAGAAVIIAFVSYIDDRSHVTVKLRLSMHLLAAIILQAGGLSVQFILLPGVYISLQIGIVYVLSVLFIIWMTNLYNFMDGMDGFAGGMAVIGFGTLGLLGLLAGDQYYATVCWIITAASAGFLVWNFPPARIFMGDTGSSVLGLLVAGMSLWADRGGLFPLWLAIMVFTPFIFDATLTLAQRTLKGERVWEAHRSHYYQRLVQAGWSHRRTVLWEYGFMVLSSIGAVVAFHAPMTVQWLMIGMVLGTCLAAVIGVRHVEHLRLAGQTPKVPL